MDDAVNDYIDHYLLAMGFLREAERCDEAQIWAAAIRAAWSAEHEARQMALSLEAARVEADRGLRECP